MCKKDYDDAGDGNSGDAVVACRRPTCGKAGRCADVARDERYLVDNEGESWSEGKDAELEQAAQEREREEGGKVSRQAVGR